MMDGFFIIVTAPTKEFSVCDEIVCEFGIETVTACPYFTKTTILKHRKTKTPTKIHFPLYPRYVFAKMPFFVDWTKLRDIRGVHGVLFSGLKPAVIKDSAVQEFSSIGEKESELLEDSKSGALFSPGERVMISNDHKLLFGRFGTVLKGGKINIEFGGNNLKVEIPMEFLEKIVAF